MVAVDLLVFVLLFIFVVRVVIHVVLPIRRPSLVLLSDEVLELLEGIKELFFLFFVELGYLAELLVQKGYEDTLDGGDVRLVDQCRVLVGFEIDI